MADPISMMAIASIGATAAGAGVGAFGSYERGNAEQNMYNFRAQVANINAGIAEKQAISETEAGEVRAEVSGLKTADRAGMERAGVAAGNLDPGSGSAKQVVASTHEIGDFEQQTIRNDAARRAYGQRVSEFGDITQANLDVAAGQGAKTASEFDVATSILGGVSSVGDKWTKFGNEGIAPFSTG